MKLSAKMWSALAGIQVISFFVSYAIVGNDIVSLRWYLLSEVVRDVLTLTLLWVFLQSALLGRLARFVRDLSDIMRNNVFSRRIHLSGSDELAEMALLVNSLFDMVEMTEEELKLRITHRSDRLEHLSDLN